jgi:hypothetical protein
MVHSQPGCGGDNPRISVRINQKMTADAKFLAASGFVSPQQHLLSRNSQTAPKQESNYSWLFCPQASNFMYPDRNKLLAGNNVDGSTKLF